MISVAQIKAARAMLGWSTLVLAEAAGVSVATIKKYEQQAGIPRANARILASIVRSLNAEGVEFTGDPLINPGVTLILEKRVQSDD